MFRKDKEMTKVMNKEEAIEAMLDGKKVKTKDMAGFLEYRVNAGGFYHIREDGHPITINISIIPNKEEYFEVTPSILTKKKIEELLDVNIFIIKEEY